jgi:hypothetical protein
LPARSIRQKEPSENYQMISRINKIKRKYDLSDNIYNTFLQKEVKLI